MCWYFLFIYKLKSYLIHSILCTQSDYLCIFFNVHTRKIYWKNKLTEAGIQIKPELCRIPLRLSLAKAKLRGSLLCKWTGKEYLPWRNRRLFIVTGGSNWECFYCPSIYFSNTSIVMLYRRKVSFWIGNGNYKFKGRGESLELCILVIALWCKQLFGKRIELTVIFHSCQ